MFTFYDVLQCNKKLETLPKLEISEWSCNPGPDGYPDRWNERYHPIRFKDLGLRTAEKLKKKIINNYYMASLEANLRVLIGSFLVGISLSMETFISCIFFFLKAVKLKIHERKRVKTLILWNETI